MNSLPEKRPVERLESISRSAFETECMLRQRPVILTKAMVDWTAIRQWNLAYLESELGRHPVSVEHYPTGNRSEERAFETMELGNYIRMIRDQPELRKQYYIAEKTIDSVLPTLAGDIVKPSVIGQRKTHRVVFIGWDTYTAAHYHRYKTQAMLTQIVGEKHLTLYPATDLTRLYLNPWYADRPNFSRVPFATMSDDKLVDRFPKLAGASPWECTLRPGEMLFIPDHWMHIVDGLGENISVAFFWHEPWRFNYLPGLVRDYVVVYTQMVRKAFSRAG